MQTATTQSQQTPPTQAQTDSEQGETTLTGVPTEWVTAITPTEILPPSVALVPSGNFTFVETSYEPHPDVTTEEVANLSDRDLLTGLKKQHTRTLQEIDAYLVYFDEAVRRFAVEQPRSDGGHFARKDTPTLPEAFNAIGRHYETERKRAWRYRNARNTRLRLPKPPSFSDGERVTDANSGECVFIGEPKDGEAEIVPVGGNLEDATRVPTKSLVRVPVKKLELNDLILCTDNDEQYRYIGKGLFKCEDVSPVIKQKQDRDAATIKQRQEQMIANAEATTKEKAHHNDLHRDEMTSRDRHLVIEKPDRDKKKSHEPKAVRAQDSTDTKTKSKAELEAEKKKAQEKAKQKAQDEARRVEIEASTDAVVARYGYDESSRFMGKQDGEEVVEKV